MNVALLLFLTSLTTPGATPVLNGEYVMVYFEGGSSDFTDGLRTWEQAGVRLSQRIPPLAIGKAVKDISQPETLSGHLIPRGEPFPPSLSTTTTCLDEGPRLAIQAWNTGVDFQATSLEKLRKLPIDLHKTFETPDAFPAPDYATAQRNRAPSYFSTSDFMAGSIAVGILFPESNGQLDPSTEDWTEGEQAKAFAEVMQGMEWWVETQPAAGLSFTYETHTLSTRYEPINRRGGPSGDEDAWMREIFTGLGFPGIGAFNQARDYINDLRSRLGTDWAFTLALVDSSNDADNYFPNNRLFAWTYLGGPYMIACTGNDNWGPDLLDMTLAHELGHVFWSLDEYAASNCSCTDTGGKNHTLNGNCELCADNPINCIMRGGPLAYNSHAICTFTQSMVGWTNVPAFSLAADPPAIQSAGTFRILLGANHYGLEQEVDLYLALELGDVFYFFPSWGQAVEQVTFLLPAAMDAQGAEVFRLDLGPGLPPFTCNWYLAVADHQTGELLDFDGAEFRYDP